MWALRSILSTYIKSCYDMIVKETTKSCTHGGEKMGLFGGGDDEPSRGEQLAQQQMELNQQELESKRAKLYQEKLDIIKGQGGQTWQADRSAPAGASQPNKGRGTPFI
jgi:hypothetical protein